MLVTLCPRRPSDAGWSDIVSCPDAAIAAPLDGHTAGNSLRVPGMANSPFPAGRFTALMEPLVID
jgi:hypothetical protein